MTQKQNAWKKLCMGILTWVLVASPGHAAGPKLIPVVSGQFSTGQWYFEGEESSLGGNASISVIPALQYSNRFTLIPSFDSNYRGTRSAEELAGGSTLFQDTWENGIGVMAVHGLSKRWKLKERVGLRTKWFRETTDESWSNGLYDYQTAKVGTEVEYQWAKRSSMALGYDYSLLIFPNYESLESTQPDDLAREYAGDDVLNQNVHLATLRYRSPLFLGLGLQTEGYYSPRNYTDQTIVQPSGLLSATKREDVYAGGNLTLDHGFKVTSVSSFLSSVFYGYTNNDSNQNHYDARLTTFLPDFYDYHQQRIGTQLTYIVGRPNLGPMTFDLGYSYSRRDYDHRVIQFSNGNYKTEKLWVTETALTLGFSYPLSRSFRLQTTSTFGRSKSNNEYEAVYRYNYDNANYQFGFSYDY